MSNNDIEDYKSQASRAMPSAGSHLPSSAEEVVIRTMASDLSAMGAEGKIPRGERVRLNTAPNNKDKQPRKSEEHLPPPEQAPVAEQGTVEDRGIKRYKFNPVKISMYVGGGVVIVATLFAAGYFVYPFLTGERTPPATELPPDNDTPEVVTPPASVHRSLFRLPPQAALSLPLADNLDLSETLPGLVANVAAETDIMEVLVERGSDSVDWDQFLSAIGSDIPPEVFGENFDQDFTMFVERGAEGVVRTGYILVPLPGKIQVLLQRDLIQLESLSSELSPLFSSDPGNPESSFRDGLIAGHPVRRLNFSLEGAEFIYGWVDGRLLMATSESAWRKAAALL